MEVCQNRTWREGEGERNDPERKSDEKGGLLDGDKSDPFSYDVLKGATEGPIKPLADQEGKDRKAKLGNIVP